LFSALNRSKEIAKWEAAYHKHPINKRNKIANNRLFNLSALSYMLVCFYQQYISTIGIAGFGVNTLM
jgi:hypothetical protein